MRQDTAALASATYDLPEQQHRNGRKTGKQELKHNCHGECIQWGNVVKTLARKALADGLIDNDGYNAILFYQKLVNDSEGLGAVKVEKIRVDGGRIDMGNSIINQISAQQMLNEVRMLLPEAIVCRKKVDYPRQAFDAIAASPGAGHDGLGYGELGKIYRPSLNDYSASREHGKRAIEAVVRAIVPIWERHSRM